MKAKIPCVSILIITALILAGPRAKASGDPFGGYCIVQKVVVGQDEGKRPSVQIWGVCAMATPSVDAEGNFVGAGYGQPQHGYLYYFSPKGKEDIAAKEWADLQHLAGTGEVVGIGSRSLTSRLRWADEKPQSPTEYPTQMGLAKITSNPAYAKLVAALKKTADGR